MKVKILIAPLLIVSMVALLIWIIYPAYTNGVDGVKEKRAEYEKEKGTLNIISQKTANMESLYASLAAESNKPKEDTLMKYVPDSIKEEEVINNLNYLITNEGLSVTNLSVAQPAKKEEMPVLPVEPTGDSAEATDEAAEQIVPAVPDMFKVNFSAVGSYDKIKSLIDKIYKLERFNGVTTLSIDKLTDQSGASDGNNLQAVGVLEFALFGKTANPANPQNPVFAKSNFNWAVVDKINSSKNVNATKLNVDSSSRANPFLP